MAKKDYLPTSQAELDEWLKNYLDEIDAIVATLGIPAAEVDPRKAKMQAGRDAYSNKNTAKVNWHSVSNTYKTTILDTITASRELTNIVKGYSGYVESMGEKLGAEKDAPVFDPTNAKPEIKLVKEVQNVTVKFNKPKEVSGVVIQSQRGNETEYFFLSIDTNSPYHDARPNLVAGQPETRKYRAIFFDDDMNDWIGQWSDVVSIEVLI